MKAWFWQLYEGQPTEDVWCGLHHEFANLSMTTQCIHDFIDCRKLGFNHVLSEDNVTCDVCLQTSGFTP